MDKGMDERQLMVRGRIFKHAFFVLIGLLLLQGILQGLFGIRFFEGAWSDLMIVLTAITFMGSEMVWKDAYPLPKLSQTLLFVLTGVFGLISFIIGVVGLAAHKESFVASASLSESAALLYMGFIYIFTCIIFVVRLVKDKNIKQEE